LSTDPTLIKVAATHREPSNLAAEQAREQAFASAEASARKVAASLGVRLLGIHTRSEQLTTRDLPQPGESLIEARVELEYRISKFSQARLDARMLSQTRDLPGLFQKALAAAWFQLRYRAETFFSRREPAPAQPRAARALIAGHFSIPGGGGTFGDIEALDTVCEWLSQAGIEFEVASNQEDGVSGPSLLGLDERKFGIFIFVCGPWYPRKKIPALLLRRFGHCLKIGVNLTTFEPGGNGFDYLLARDNQTEQHADLAFGRQAPSLPVVGVLLVGRQKVYGVRQRHDFVRQVVEEFIATGEVAPVYLDTNAYRNAGGLKNYRQFESIIRKLDVVLTNRLHGLVLSRKNGVPVIAIDAVAGGGKLSAQARALGWPVLIPAEELSVERIRESLRLCLQEHIESGDTAQASLESSRARFLEILGMLK